MTLGRRETCAGPGVRGRSRDAARMRTRADVAELVDAHGSGPCGGNSVEVRVLSSASRAPASAIRSARAVAVALVVACALAVPAVAAAPSSVIQGDYRIGSYAVMADGGLRGAIAAFGPTSTRRRDGEFCQVRWRSHGIRASFYNLGGLNPCTPAGGRFSEATMSGSRWQTAKGLAIGAPLARLRALYPRATYRVDRFYGRGWWLVVRRSRFGVPQDYPGLRATIRNGRVSSFVVSYPAGGD